jgi:hypothetical protein
MGMLCSVLHGRCVWMTVAVFIFAIVMTVVAVASAVCFFHRPVGDVRGMILDASIFLASVAMLMAAKIWVWMRMERKVISDQIGQLAKMLDERTGLGS